MQLDTTRLTFTEWQNRLTLGLCIYCGDGGHAITTCPVRPPRPTVGVVHSVSVNMRIAGITTAGIILGCPWLVQHDPNLSCTTGEVLEWGYSCFSGCFPHLPRPIQLLLVNSTSIASSVEHRWTSQSATPPSVTYSVPKKTLLLPPHWPWDCAIDLLPGELVPHGKIYALSIPEQRAM